MEVRSHLFDFNSISLTLLLLHNFFTSLEAFNDRDYYARLLFNLHDWLDAAAAHWSVRFDWKVLRGIFRHCDSKVIKEYVCMEARRLFCDP